MGKRDAYAPGVFCWVDATDPQGAAFGIVDGDMDP